MPDTLNRVRKHVACFSAVVWLPAVALLLMLAGVGNSEPAESGRPNIPSIATFAGGQVGYITMDELEKRLGPGKPITGGHPHGARLWRVRATDWTIYADAFEYSKRGIVVDDLRIYRERKFQPDLPVARPGRSDLLWLGRIAVGMSESQVARELAKVGNNFRRTPAGYDIKAGGHYWLNQGLTFNTWQVSLGITNRVLVRIQMDAR